MIFDINLSGSTLFVLTIIFSSLTVFFLVAGIGSNNPKKKLLQNDKPLPKHHWLWTDFIEKMYDAIFQNRSMSAVGRKLSFDLEEYESACRILERKAEPKKEIMLRMTAYVTLAVCTITVIITFFLPAIVLALTVYVVFCMLRDSGLKHAVEMKKANISYELPRFADLLYASLVIGMPIELAIEIVASKLPGDLAVELKRSITKAKIGADSWEGALESLANKYEIDELSDFVMDMVTSTKQGVPVAESVGRKSAEMKHERILKAREAATKMSSAIIAPIMIFKMMPLILLMLMPLMTQMQGFTLF